jgi:uncharacterized protein (DUF849 family)
MSEVTNGASEFILVAAWGLIAEAAARGYGTRVGFEDTLTLPDGSMAESNAVQEARRVLDAR